MFLGFAQRCAERLCLFGQMPNFLRGYTSNSRRSLVKLGETFGKAQPFRTSGGSAAKTITQFVICRNYKASFRFKATIVKIKNNTLNNARISRSFLTRVS